MIMMLVQMILMTALMKELLLKVSSACVDDADVVVSNVQPNFDADDDLEFICRTHLWSQKIIQI